MLYPMNLNLEGRRCIVLGGGAVALRKVRTLLEAGAEVILLSPVASEELCGLAETGRLIWRQETYRQGALPQGFLLIAATDDEQANRQAIGEAKAAGMLVNAPAQPELSDFSVPAKLKRGELLITVSTGDHSPACARWIREILEDEFTEDFASWLEILSGLREELKEKMDGSREREAFWRQALNREIFALVKQGELKQAEVRIRNAIGCNRVES